MSNRKPLNQERVLFECSIVEIMVLRMLRRAQYGQYTVHLQDGNPNRIEGHESKMLNEDLIRKEFNSNDDEIKRVISELKLDIK